MSIDRRLLGWGAFFILVGAIPLAVRANVLDPTLVERWPSLWPVLLIGWGVGLLLRRTPLEWIGGAVTAITFGVMGGGALATGFGGMSLVGGCTSNAPSQTFQTQQGTIAANGQLNIEFNCGTLAIQGAAGAEWSVSGTESNGRAPDVSTSGSTVSIEGASGGAFFSNVGRARWTVSVPTTPTLGVGFTLNAGEGQADLAGTSLSSVDLTVNAGSFRLGLDETTTLGDVNATVNAGAARILLSTGDRSVNLSLNAGSLDVCVPAGAPLLVDWSGALGSNNLDTSGLTKVDGNTWVSAGFDDAQPHMELHVSANAGSFGLDADGSCDA